MSKGHCYLAQLIALDMVFKKNVYTDLYMKEINFCGHPKKNINNFHFKVSSGSLGQGVTVASGIAYAEKIKNSKKIILVVLGDGELNEGCVIESIRCAATLSLPIIFILDDNNQISLDKNLFRFQNHLDFCNSINIKYIELNGNDFIKLNELYSNIFTSQIVSPIFIRLKTIKGYGVSFMERNYNWHHRRPKNNEIELAIHELSELL
jgi:transketolase